MTSLNFIQPAAADHRQVDGDVACRKCQYNLRGMGLDSRCPECGTLVLFSMRGKLLRHSDPSWVAGLRIGAVCMLCGGPMAVVGAFISTVIPFRQIWVAASMVSTLGSILHLYGAWLLTAADPGGLGEDCYGTLRKLIRVTLLIGLFQYLINFLTTNARFSAEWRAVTTGLIWAAAAVNLAGLLAMLKYLTKLAWRIPDEPLADRAEHLKCEFAISIGLIGMLLLFAWGADHDLLPRGLIGFALLIVPCFLAVVVVGVRYLLFMASLSLELRDQTEHAVQAWTAPRGHM